MSKRDAYIEKMKTQLDELNAKMSELEAKAQEAKEDARAKYKEGKAPSHPSVRHGQAHARLTLFRRDRQWRSDTGRISGGSILMLGIKAT
jgi:seryl-tRNA synthetase